MNNMKIFNIIDEYGDDFGIKQISDDVDFYALGLANANLDVSFCTFIDNPKYISTLSDKATVVITKEEIAKLINDRTVLISDNPRISYFTLHNFLSSKEYYQLRPSFKTIIGKNSKISNLAYISDHNVRIGDNVIIEEFVSIKENTVIGDNTIIRSGTVIGSEGYEFKRVSNEVIPVKHIGWVEIGNNVEIQHNTCIDKAIYPWDVTRISDFCKIDNLVHIAHAVKLHRGVFIVAGSLIGGRTIIGENSWIGVGATLSNGLNIGRDVRANLGSVVTKDIEDSISVSGNFAIEHRKFIEFIKSIR